MLPLKLTCFLLLCGAISALDHDHHAPHHPETKQKYLQEEKTIDIVSPPLESFNFVPLSKIDKNFEITENSSDKEVADDAERFGYKVDEEKTPDTSENNANNENESNLKPPQDTDDMFLDSFFPTLLFLLSQPIYDEMIPQQQIEGPFGDAMCSEEPEKTSQLSSIPPINIDLNIDIKLDSLPTSRAPKPINKFRRMLKQQKQKLQNQKRKQQRKRLRKLQKMQMQMQMQNRQIKMNPFRLPMRRVPQKFRNGNKRRGGKFNNKRRQQNQQPTILFFDPIDSGLPTNNQIFESPKTGGNQGSSSLFDLLFMPPPQQQQQQKPKQDDIIFFDFGGGVAPKQQQQKEPSLMDLLFGPPQQQQQQQKPKQDDFIFLDFGGGAPQQQQQKQPSLMDLLFAPPQQQQQNQQQQPKQDDFIFIDLGPVPQSNKPKQSEPLDFFFYPDAPQQKQQQQPKQDDIIFFDLGGGSPKSGKQDVTSLFDLLFFSPPGVQQQQQPKQEPSKDIPIYFEIITLDAEPQRNEPQPQYKSAEPTFFDFFRPQQQQQFVQEPAPKPKEETHKFPFFDFIF